MALTESQIIDCLLVLDLPARTDVTFALGGEQVAMRNSEIARKALTKVSVDQEARVVAILAQWEQLAYTTDKINAEGLESNPYRDRARLKSLLANTIGFRPHGAGAFGMHLGRG